MKEYSTYIFDLDGTLLNTLEDLYISTNYALEQQGLPTHTKDQVRQMVGNGVSILIHRALPKNANEELYQKVLTTFREHYLKHGKDHTAPYEGIKELLQNLKAKGKRIAVVSNKFDRAVKELCEQYFGEYIKVAIGESADIKRKPAPDTVYKALQELNTDTNDAVYIGDSDVDIQTARNCNIPCISVLWGFRSKGDLLKNGAETLVEKPGEIFQT